MYHRIANVGFMYLDDDGKWCTSPTLVRLDEHGRLLPDDAETVWIEYIQRFDVPQRPGDPYQLERVYRG